eukprot:XP_010651824.1 PREDICTED: uncharacterized protein DDB_G0290803 isoform X2 [Vitis vinifera]
MATENKANPNPNTTKNKKRKQRYLPHNKPVKKKGGYPLHPGVQGFFITCDGGRERQASREALNVIDSFFEELVHGKDSGVKLSMLPNKPMNKKIKFSYSDSGSDDDDDDIDDEEDKSDLHREKDANDENPSNEKSHPQKNDDVCRENQNKEKADDKTQDGNENQENDADGEKADKNTEDGNENQEVDAEEPSAKKQCLETDASTHIIHEKTEEKSIDKLIEAELQELGDRNKRRFGNLDSGCNGVVFVQMRKKDGDPSPKEIVQHMMTSAASTRKHMSRFILRVLPVEATCYASEEEISIAIKPLVEQYFPVETQNPKKVCCTI